jgi:multicomponent Na+:H+ antiporter subunit A
LWHGVNLAFVLSILTLAAGIGIYLYRAPLAAMTIPLSARGPADLYKSSLEGFLRFSYLLTHFLQSGYLRYYLMIILVSTVSLIGYTAFVHGHLVPSVRDFKMDPLEAAICLLIPIACWATIRANSRLGAIVALGVVGYSVALIFVVFGAPDLAMTQFLIETLTVVLFVFAFYRLPKQTSISTRTARCRDAILAIAVGAIMTTLVLLTNQHDRSREVADYYEAHSVPDGHGRNIVNVILVDFRALDTLGEITVLALAAVGVYSLLKLRPSEESS